MIKLLKADEVAEILRVSRRTAYAKMREMVHLENPLRVTEVSLNDWIREHTIDPAAEKKMAMVRKRSLVPSDYFVPKRRTNAV